MIVGDLRHFYIKIGGFMIDKKELSIFQIFDGYNEKQLGDILTCGEILRFKKDESIFHESNISLELFLLVDGIVSVKIEPLVLDKNTQDKALLAILGAGEVFGEMAFIQGRKRSAHIRALENVRVLKLDGLKLYDLFEKQNYIGYIFMRNLAIILAQRLLDINYRWKNEVDGIK